MKIHTVLPAPPEFRIELVKDESPPGGGFLRRLSRRLVTVSSTGARSSTFIYDEVDREALDAVVVLPHFVRLEAGQRVRYVVLRSAVRPPVALRSEARSPISERENRGLWELPAGLVEKDEYHAVGLSRAAARELEEETGLCMPPQAFRPLGPSTFPAPGVIAERHFYFQVEVDPERAGVPSLDGSPLEEAGEVIALPLSACLKAARLGKLEDAKTELALRRLSDELTALSGDEL